MRTGNEAEEVIRRLSAQNRAANRMMALIAILSGLAMIGLWRLI